MMAGHEENNSLAISYMTQKHLRCCCVDAEPSNTPCVKCKPVQQICCLLATHSLWVKKFVFVRLYPGPTFGEEGDPCDEKGATNLCGTLYGRWPNWGHPCVALPTLTWQVSNDCKTVRMVYQLSSSGLTASASVDLPRDWFTGPVVIENVPGGGDVTVEPCPDPWPEAFTEEEATTEFLLRGWRQVKQSGTWTTDGYWVTSQGVCLCGIPVWCPGANPFSAYAFYRLGWVYDPYIDKTVVSIYHTDPDNIGIIIEDGRKEFDGSGCAWSETPFTIVHAANSNIRWKIERVEDCDDPGSGPPPDEEECDPGCWPLCVMCPERKALFAVLTGAPTCCVSGAWALTWVGTGGEENPTVGYYELPAPVGGPIGTCGIIDFLRVYCSGGGAIQVDITYRRADGDVITSNGNVLSVTCDGEGQMESAAMSFPGRSGDRDSLCGYDDTVGGDLRIVSA